MVTSRVGCLALGAALFLSGCLPQGSQLPESPLLRVFERKSGRIAFLGIDGNVYTTDQTGSDPIAVTDDALIEGRTAALYRSPTWSADSSRLALVRHTFDGEVLTDSSLVVADLETLEVETVFRSEIEFPIYASWSPAGDQLALLTGRSSGSNFTLWSVPAEAGVPTAVDVGRPVYWSWAPAGDGLLVHLDGSIDDNPGLARVSFLALGETVREFGLGVDPYEFQAPALSPTGDGALVAALDDAGEPVLMLTSPLGDARQAVAALAGPATFAWAPDGRSAAYLTYETTDEGVVGRLRALDLSDPAHPVELAAPDHPVVAFFWSPDSRNLLSYSASALAGQESGIILTMHVTELPEAETRRLGSFRPTQPFLDMLAYFDQFHQAGTVWSPDSRSVVFPAITDSGQPAVFVLLVSGTVEPRGIVEGTFAVWSWQ